LKKCPKCNSICSDTHSSCGVCGGSLSGVISESLEQLVQKETRLQPKKKLKLGPLGLGTFALATTIAGAALLLFNGIGIILLLAGLSVIIVMLGGAGGHLSRGKSFQRRRSMTSGQEEVWHYAEEQEKRKGEKE
jgi:hypothetical protein